MKRISLEKMNETKSEDLSYIVPSAEPTVIKEKKKSEELFPKSEVFYCGNFGLHALKLILFSILMRMGKMYTTRIQFGNMIHLLIGVKTMPK